MSLTSRGRIYLSEIIAGTYSSALNGANKIAIYGSVSGAADAIIGSAQSLTWVTGSPDSLYSTVDYLFTVSADTVVKGFVYFSDDIVGTTLDTHNVWKEEFNSFQTFVNEGTLTIENPSLSFQSGGNLTTAGKIALYKCLGGDYSATGYAGFDKVAIAGSIDGASDGLIGSVSATSWGTPDVTVAFSADKDFTIASNNTTIKKFLLFETADGVTYGEEFASYTFPTPYTYDIAGIFRADSVEYGIE